MVIESITKTMNRRPSLGNKLFFVQKLVARETCFFHFLDEITYSITDCIDKFEVFIKFYI